MNIRVGQGIDFHRLENGLKLFIGGISIPSEKGCVAHSDGDVLLHAMCDALLGAAGLGDIGYHFPDTRQEFKGIDSRILLGRTYRLVKNAGFSIVNLDSTICLEKPKVGPYINDMKSAIAEVLETSPENIGIKATTAEKLGFIGKEEGVVAIAVALINKV